MKKNRKKVALSAVLGLSLIGGLYSIGTSFKGHAVNWGQSQFKTLPDTTTNPPMFIRFNSAYRNSSGQQIPQSQWYGTQKLYREVYPGGFVWYTVSPPPAEHLPLSRTDMSLMLENRQTLVGYHGDHHVPNIDSKPYANNLKLGSVDPGSLSYNGDNSGSKTILYGDFKGKNYEWRFLGYTLNGTAIGNPYFPNDVDSARYQGNTKPQTAKILANYNWQRGGFGSPLSQKLFGGFTVYNQDWNIKYDWINRHLFVDYPELKAAHPDPAYWADRLMPMSNPDTETGVWLGWHYGADGQLYYRTVITNAPKQSNLRLMDYKIYDDNHKLIAEAKRGTDYYVNTPTVKKFQTSVTKGATYHVEVDVENMPDVKKNITNMPITLNNMVSYDGLVGNINQFSVSHMNAQGAKALPPYSNNLPTGKTAHFKYDVTVPTTGSPTKSIQFQAEVPSKFGQLGYNVNTNDDNASIIFAIKPNPPENLAVKFNGYYDWNKNPVESVVAGRDLYVEYTVTKDKGSKTVTNPELTVRNTDEVSTTENQTVTPTAVYDKNGNVLADGTMRHPGDYAVYWVPFKPNVPKMCSQATIPSKYKILGVNDDPQDDVAKAPCLADTDNIIVSNFQANPANEWLAPGQSSKAVSYSVNFNLTNDAARGDKQIPLVYTIDGRIVFTEELVVKAGATVGIARTLPNVYLGQGTHQVQVEANPNPRKFVEYLGNGQDPYRDNIGSQPVTITPGQSTFSCPYPHPHNEWTTRFYFYQWWGHYECDKDGCWCVTDRTAQWTRDIPFHEDMRIQHIYFRSKSTVDKVGGNANRDSAWVDVVNGTPAVIKAGYGFELRVVTNYSTNTYNDTPKSWEEGCNGLSVHPSYTPVNPTERIRVVFPFRDDYGNQVSMTLVGATSGIWYDQTSQYTFNTRTVIDHPEQKLYVSPETRDGDYTMRVETEPFYGSYDKPYYQFMGTVLCDVKNVTIRVKGSYLDDLHTHIIQ
ncbi:hypothetical protein PP175_27115 (plasmid) [Aneurinibacillus sp. Ricciae_BoGa-3]|uniref:hypothetical protein n=1 Tax=Aneurinibacillus sp. Ricciae_BoGa-3 TaxID=3022697 RepID=UPI00233FDFF2|nr:hypothetical protein [Aneurinibacillus sp. Ricciae_BoGa-3]WCK57710.1 hypothetical protein PP175_27115 [Aneurinibacillus sp. Ricciae_BoGa-3]